MYYLNKKSQGLKTCRTQVLDNQQFTPPPPNLERF